MKAACERGDIKALEATTNGILFSITGEQFAVENLSLAATRSQQFQNTQLLSAYFPSHMLGYGADSPHFMAEIQPPYVPCLLLLTYYEGDHHTMLNDVYRSDDPTLRLLGLRDLCVH